MMTSLLDRTKEPVTKGFTSLAIPSPVVEKLPNGIGLYAIDAGDQPLNRLTVSFDSGMIEAKIPDALLLATQLLREGTPSYTGSMISETLDYHGAWLKCDAMSHNAAISLWSLNNSTVKLLPLLKEMLTAPTFPDKEFSALKQKHKAKYLLSQKNVSYVAAMHDKRLVFGENHPINRILNADEIDALTADDIKTAWRNTYSGVPKVFITGEISELLPEIKDFLGGMQFPPSKQTTPEILPMAPAPGTTSAVIDVDAEHQAALAMSIPTIGRTHPDYIPLRLAVMALGGYFGSRLMSNIREDKGYTYGIQANLLGYREGGVVSIMTNTAPQYADAVIRETKYEILRLREEPMDADELAKLKSNAMTSLAAILDTPFSIMDHHISQFHTGTPPDYFSKQVEAINNLTSADITRLARKHIDIGKMLITVARPAAARSIDPDYSIKTKDQ